MRPRPPPRSPGRAASPSTQGLHYVYTGNVHDMEGGTTFCPGCGKRVIERDWYEIESYDLTADGRCTQCGTAIAGRFGKFEGQFGRHRVPVRVNIAA